MAKSNKISLSYKDNEDLKAALTGVEIGTKVTLEVTVMATSNDENYFEGDVEDIGVTSDVEDEDMEESDDEEEAPSKESSVAVTIAARGKTKK